MGIENGIVLTISRILRIDKSSDVDGRRGLGLNGMWAMRIGE